MAYLKEYKTDKEKMLVALKEAKKAYKNNEVPIGSAAFYNNFLIAKDFNKVIKLKDPTAHSEILVLKKSAKKLDNYRLTELEIFTTIEPCLMCFSAMVHSRIKRLVFGCKNPKWGFSKFIKKSIIKKFNHQFEIKKNILKNDCAFIIKKFFEKKR